MIPGSNRAFTPNSSRWGINLFWLSLSLLSIGILSGPIRFWDGDGYILSPSGIYSVSTGLVLLLVAIFVGIRAKLDFGPSARIISILFLLIFITDWFCRPYSLFPGPSIRGEILLLACLVVPFWKYRKRIILLVSSIFPIWLLACFMLESNGRLLISDDHSVFIYRLSLLKENFPTIPFYNPLWNAGVDARDFFATGALNIFLLFSPLLYIFKVTSVYTLIVGLIVFVLIPTFTYFAARLVDRSTTESAIASILSLASSLFWYRWCLKFGSLGFVLSAAIVPLNLSLFYRLIFTEKIRIKEGLVFVISFSLMLLWSPTGLIFIPLGLIGLCRIKTLWNKKYFRTIAVAIVFLNLPWIMMFLSVSNVSHFVKSEAPSFQEQHDMAESSLNSRPTDPTYFKSRSREICLATILKEIRIWSVSVNPIILFGLIPGILLIRSRSTRLSFSATYLWLIFLGTIVGPTKPQLEFDRMLIVLSLCGAVPAAVAFAKIIEEIDSLSFRYPLSSLGAIVTFGFVLVTPFIVSSVIKNRSLEHYYFSDGSLAKLSEAINRYGGEGRALFSGFVLHELDNAHLAPLAIFSRIPLVASSPYHNIWKYQDVIPKSFLSRGDEGIIEYFDTMNATSIIAHEKYWRTYFESRPDDYERVWSGQRFTIYKRKRYTGNYFLEGSGEILEQDSNSVTLKTNSPSLTIKFRYFDFLKSSCGALTEKVVSPELSIIKVDGCPPGSTMRIDSKGPIQRMLHDY